VAFLLLLLASWPSPVIIVLLRIKILLPKRVDNAYE